MGLGNYRSNNNCFQIYLQMIRWKTIVKKLKILATNYLARENTTVLYNVLDMTKVVKKCFTKQAMI
jgi:hypothetical protein